MRGLKNLYGIVALLVSCHQGTMPGRASHRIAGTVTGSNGSPQIGDVRIQVTDLESESRIAIVRADSTGKFLIDLADGDYAFALTSSNAFAFVQRVTIPTTSLPIQLSADCTPINGRLVSSASRDLSTSTVVLERRSKFTGDAFPVAVASDGRFTTCLPAGRYLASVRGAATSIVTPTTIPAAGPLMIEVFPVAAIEAPPIPERFSGTTFDDMVTAQSHRANVLGLGEANHGTADFYALRGALSLALARSSDLRFVIIEADAVTMLQVDDYVQGRAVAIEQTVAALKFWVTDIKEFLQFLRDVRTFNYDRPSSHRLHVLGMDAQFPAPAAQFLLTEQDALAIAADEQRVLKQIASAERDALGALSPSDIRVLESLLTRLGRIHYEPGADVLNLPARAIIAASSLRHQLDHSRAPGMSWDKIMADVAILVWEVGGQGRMCIWAHNGHIARKPSGAADSTGGYLAERFGRGYYAIGFLSYDGSARAWGLQNRGVIPHNLGLAPRYNLESAIMSALGFPHVAWVRFDSISATLQKWLELPRYVREFGSAYVASDTQTLRWLPESFDAAVVVKRSSPSSPTPTGERGPQ
jgi:erythromycin esterase